jgi:hypothetical protein
MRRLALALATLLAGAPALAQQPLVPPPPPPWMPAPPPSPSRESEREVRKLRHEALAYGTIGLVFTAAGIAVDVVALDVPQSEQATRMADGTTVTEKVRGDANWAELAGGIALTATGLVLVTVSLFRLKQARRLAALE